MIWENTHHNRAYLGLFGRLILSLILTKNYFTTAAVLGGTPAQQHHCSLRHHRARCCQKYAAFPRLRLLRCGPAPQPHLRVLVPGLGSILGLWLRISGPAGLPWQCSITVITISYHGVEGHSLPSFQASRGGRPRASRADNQRVLIVIAEPYTPKP